MNEYGCERLATGHYARVAREELSDGTSRMLLLETVDQSKDQSYYMYGLTQEQLSSVLFPLEGMYKNNMYALAQQFNVPFDNETYRESQDLCFFPEKTPEAFFRRYLGDALVPGNIVRRDGTVVGTHEGLPLYTVGQRRGLGIGGLKIPLEVVAKNANDNTLIVNEKGSEQTQTVELQDLRFVSWKPENNAPFEVRVRSLSTRLKGTLSYEGNRGRFTFENTVSPQAPGQSLVLYRGEEVVGGGVMA
jgi:tRNA-specific 2-thiouridylase